VKDSPVKHFKFKLETRLQDEQSGQVRYGAEDGNIVSFDLPDEIITNAAEYNAYKAAVAAAKAEKKTYDGEAVFANISFDALLGRHFADSVTPGFTSPVTGNKGNAIRRVRMKSFPKYLWLHLRKYRLAANWTPEKLDTSIDFPQRLDLGSFKAYVRTCCCLLPEETKYDTSCVRRTGLQDGETEMKAAEAAAPTVDEAALAMLLPFGFSENACRRAVRSSPCGEGFGRWCSCLCAVCTSFLPTTTTPI